MCVGKTTPLKVLVDGYTYFEIAVLMLLFDYHLEIYIQYIRPSLFSKGAEMH